MKFKVYVFRKSEEKKWVQLKPWKDFEIHQRECDKGENRSSKQEKFLYQSWEGKKCYYFDGLKTCPIVRSIAQRTNQYYQTMLALLKKIIILKKTNVEALSNRGIRLPYFRPSKSVAVNTECLQPRLLPFIHTDLSDLYFQFVHDLAGADHSKPAIG